MDAKMRLPRRKWVHPLKGRTVKEAMADALGEACVDKDGKGPSFDEGQFFRNTGIDICYNGLCSWGTYQHQSFTGDNYHSWDSMKNCLKYGFEIGDNCCITAKDTDWNQRQLMEKA